jgi:N-methylhydantoinase B
MFFNNGGGGGASRGADGWPLIATVACLGGLKAMSVELLEQLFPIRLERMEVEPGSMGLGEWNGGPGLRTVVRPLHGDMTVVTFGDGCENPPHGVLGGTPGIGGGQWVERPGEDGRSFASACATLEVPHGGAWVGVSSGGGGYGDPFERDPDSVRCDVRDGLIDRATARGVFGVLLDDAPDPADDVLATDALRWRNGMTERPQVCPAAPSAGTWRLAEMRRGDRYLVDPA